MRTLRRIGMLGLAGVVITAFAAPTAHAATGTPETFSATGAARALHVSVLGTDATFGVTNGNVGAPLTAVANAAGQLLAPASLSKVSLSSDNSSASDPTTGVEKCAPPVLPSPLGDVVKASLACALAKANITNGLPNATSSGGVATIGVNAQTVLSNLLGNATLSQVTGTAVDTVQQALDPVLKQIADATSQTPLKIDPQTKLKDLLNALTTQQTLSLDLGKATSNLTSVAANVTSTSTAAGGTIKLLPIAALNNTPLAAITIGSSQTSAVYDRVKGAGSASFDAALVTVRLANVLGLQLPAVQVPQAGLDCHNDTNGDIVCTIAPGQSLTILQGTPLESTITVADGKTTSDGKSASAVADGVSVQLFKGLSSVLPTTAASSLHTAAASPSAAVVVELAHSESTVSGAPAVVPPNPNSPTPPTVKSLAFTGTSPWLSIGGVALLAGFFGTRRLRRRITA